MCVYVWFIKHGNHVPCSLNVMAEEFREWKIRTWIVLSQQEKDFCTHTHGRREIGRKKERPRDGEKRPRNSLWISKQYAVGYNV